MLMLACPRSSCTYLGCLPAMRSIVAQVCRRSCSLIAGNPVLLRRGLKCLPNRFVQLNGASRRGRAYEPVILPESACPELLLVLAGAVGAQGASVALRESLTLLPLPFLGFSNLWPVLVSESVRLTCSVAVVLLRSWH
jgi:hypothetical protein